MNANAFYGEARRILSYVGFFLVCIALLKYLGVDIKQVPGNYWEIAILGLALK
jgi:hypothetical protein